MKYLLLIYIDENAMSDTEREHCYVKFAQVAQELHSKGQFLATAPLHPIATATSGRVPDGKPLKEPPPTPQVQNLAPSEIRPVIEFAGLSA